MTGKGSGECVCTCCICACVGHVCSALIAFGSIINLTGQEQ